MFYNRNNFKTGLVCNIKVSTFAPALREKLCNFTQQILQFKSGIIFFWKPFGSLK